MPGPLKTEAIVLRSHPLRRGRPDPAPLYPAPRAGERDRQGRAASRKSRFGGRLEPFFRARPRAPRGPQRPAHGHRRRDASPATRACASTRASLDGAARACDAVARAVRRRRPAPPASTTCSPTSSRCSTRDPAARHARQRARVPAQAAARRRLRAAAGRLRDAAASASTSSASPAPPAASSAPACEAGSFPLDAGGARLPRDALGAPAGRGARRAAPRALAPGRAGDPARRSSTTRTCGCGAVASAVGSAPWTQVGLRLRRGLAGHARPARRQGRQRRRDDARARRRARARRASRSPPRRASPTCSAGQRGARRAWPSRSPRRSSASRSTPARRSATTRTRCSSPCAPARASRCPGCSTPSSTSGLNDASVEGLARATENERFAWDSYRRFVQMFGNVVARHRRASSSRTRSRRVKADRGRQATTPSSTSTRCKELTATLQGALRATGEASRRTRRSSCARRSARCSTPGRASARSTTGASTASPTTGAPRSTSSRWCSATRATRRAPASRSAATR